MTPDEAVEARQDAIDTLAPLIEDVKVAMMTTLDDSSHVLRSRPMVTQEAPFDDGTLWFFTGRDTAKVSEIDEEHEVNLSYAAPSENRYVSVSGTARLNVDRAKLAELWSPPLRAWFPDGLDDENLALLKVQVEQAEYWDPESSTLVQITGFVKALATGERYEGGENEKLQM
jgi:general stress protein 26